MKRFGHVFAAIVRRVVTHVTGNFCRFGHERVLPPYPARPRAAPLKPLRQSKGPLALRHGEFELLRASSLVVALRSASGLSALRPDKVRVPREKGWFRKEPDQNPMRPAL
jgi:hypothetical protein